MNSTPPETAAPATEPTGQPARQRVTHYDRLVDDLAYHYEGTFARDSIAQAVADARAGLEPTATIPDFVPILVSRFTRCNSPRPPKLMGRLSSPCPNCSSCAFKTLACTTA